MGLLPGESDFSTLVSAVDTTDPMLKPRKGAEGPFVSLELTGAYIWRQKELPLPVKTRV